MLALSYYLLKVIICSGILFGYYWLALRNKLFHQYNRFYLLAAVVLSLALPVIKITFWEQSVSEKPAAIKILQVVSSSDEYLDTIIINSTPAVWSQTDWASAGYLLVTAIMLVLFLHTLIIIYRLAKKYPKQQIGNIAFVNTDAKSTPFSFLNYIFWNRNIDAESPAGKQIFKHEVAHIQEKHTYDKLFLNIVLLLFWSNPIFWLLRKELYMIHEFIADKKAVEDSDTAAFAAMILQATYPQHQFSIANNFFYSPIKRRLAMLVKNKNPKVSYWSRLLVLPVAVLLFAAFTFKQKQQFTNRYSGEKVIVVIDAGHGGKDPGAVYQSYSNGIKNTDVYEKNLALAIAKKIKAINTNNAVEIILTREEDVFMTPAEKTDFVKAKNADLLISIHTGGSPKPNTKSGIEFFVAKDESANAAQSKVLASHLINEFTSNYKLPVAALPTQRQAGIWILQSANVPAVLIEAGVINNDADYKYLKTDEAKETIAKNILAAIEKFAAAGKSNPVANENSSDGFMINVKMAKGDYLKSAEYKEKALVIIDDKELGNVGDNYIAKNNIQYSSIVIYNPENALKEFGDKGKHGVIKLTQKSVLFIKADAAVYDDKTKTLQLKGSNTELSGDFSDALIFIDNKEATAGELNRLNPEKIATINILKGDKLDGITEAKGKKAVIYVSLKPDDLPEIIVNSKTETPLYVVDGQQKDKEYVNTMNPSNIQSIDVLKGESATVLYGEKGKAGVVKITTKPLPLHYDTIMKKEKPAPLYVIDGDIKGSKYKFNKINPNDIESINTLKGEKAVTRYGEAGKNGVIEITTKKVKNQLNEVVVNEHLSTKALTKTGVIYIGVINKILMPADKTKYDIMVNITNGSINGTDDYYTASVYSTASLLRITVLKKGSNQILYNINFKAVRIPDGMHEIPSSIKLDDYLKEEMFL